MKLLSTILLLPFLAIGFIAAGIVTGLTSGFTAFFALVDYIEGGE